MEMLADFCSLEGGLWSESLQRAVWLSVSAMG